MIAPASLDGLSSSPAPWSNRPSWSGLLQLSLVGIPLKAYPAVRTRDVPSFHQLHAECGERIRYVKTCPQHGAVEAAQIVKAYEYGPRQHVILDPDELDRFRPAQDKALRLERFLDPAQVDPLQYAGKGLYLVPDGPRAQLAYEVLCQAMTQKGRWALGRIVLSGQRQVVLVRPAAQVLVLQILHYPEQVRACPPVHATSTPSSSGSPELELAGQLIDAASGAIDWNCYPDQSAQELRGLVEAKLQGMTPTPAEPEQAILPLLQALRQSLKQSTLPPRKKAPARKRSTRPA